MNELILLSFLPPIYPSIYPPIQKSTDLPTNQPINRANNESTSQPFNQSPNQQANHSINRSVTPRLNPFPNKPWFLRVCSTNLLKTPWEEEKLLVTSNFSFSHGVFYPIWRTFLQFSSNSILSSINSFSFGGNLLFGKKVKNNKGLLVAFVEDNVTMSSIRYFENHVSYFCGKPKEVDPIKLISPQVSVLIPPKY